MTKLVALLAVLALAGTFAACGDDDDNGDAAPGDTTDGMETTTDNGTTDNGTTESTIELAEVRAVHLAPSFPAVRLYVTGTDTELTQDDPLDFAQAVEFPIEVPAGTYSVDVADANDRSQVYGVVDNLVLEAGVSYSVAAVDSDDDGFMEFIVLTDDVSLTTEGTARIRGIHAAVGVDTVDVYAEADGVDRFLLFEGLSQTEAGDAQEIAAGVEFSLFVDAGQDGTDDFTYEAALTDGFVTNAYIVINDDVPVLYAHVLTGEFVLPVPPISND